jgi:hypothetical protein
MSSERNVLRINFDITYEGKKLADEHIERLRENILSAGIDAMLADKLETKALRYCMDIRHLELDESGR